MITIATADRRPVFTEATFTHVCISLLADIATDQHIAVLGYCFMPDHCHLLLRVDGEVSLIDFVRTFKGRTTPVARTHGYPGSFWQRSFYDYLLRDADDEWKYLRYLLENPVRAGLIDVPLAYPFSGSLVHDLTAGDWW